MKTEHAMWLVELWNRTVPVGRAVTADSCERHQMRTRTRSKAWLASGQPVVKVEGISGGFDLFRVLPENIPPALPDGASLLVHALFHGAALCGRHGYPALWHSWEVWRPLDHWISPPKDPALAVCEACDRLARERLWGA